MKKQILIFLIVTLVMISCKSIDNDRIKKDIVGINEQLYQLESSQIKTEENLKKISKNLTVSKIRKTDKKDKNKKAIYAKGYKLFLEENYSKAILTLEQIVLMYSNDKIIDNSLFWLAESYLKLNKLNDAVNYYKLIYRYFPFSEKADYALYKIGYIYFKQKHYNKADLAFQKILKEYQDSDFRKSSLNYRQKIKKNRSRK